MYSFPVAHGVEGNQQPGWTRPASWLSVAVPCGAGIWAGQGAGVLGRGESVAGPARRGGVGRGPARRPSRWRGTRRGAEVPETGLPAGRKCVKPRGRPGAAGRPRGASPETGEGREDWDMCPFVSWEGNGEAAVSSWGFMEWEGARLEATGGKEAAFPTGEQRAGRRAAGAASAPPRGGLPPAAWWGGCRKHFPNSSLAGRNPLLFCSQEGKKWGGGSCCHVVAPVFRLPSVHPCPPRASSRMPSAEELKKWTVRKLLSSLVPAYVVCLVCH